MATRAKQKKAETMAADIVEALGSVTKEKSIGIELVQETLKDALASAARRYLGAPINVEVNVDREKGTIEVYTRQIVVEEIEDLELHITLDEAQEIDETLQIGDELIQDLDIATFGRSAIQTAKQVIVQRVREAEREKIFDDYSERIGELVTGTVQQIDKGNILVNLGRTEALLPYREQIRRERYHQGNTIRAAIIDVRNNIKGPQVIISRTSPVFLERLFELEVPEIYEGIVKIIKVVRAPGFRAKVAVTSSDSRVDPVGACVGMRGNRVQAIVRELSNERMDIINWTDELSMLVRRVFSPAEVKRVLPVGNSKLVIIIAEENLAQAIGKEGQNIKLASRMLDKEIDVYGDEEFNNFTDEEREAALLEPESDSKEDSLFASFGKSVSDSFGERELTEADIFKSPAPSSDSSEALDSDEEDSEYSDDDETDSDDSDEILRNSGEDESDTDDDETPVQAIMEDAIQEDSDNELIVDDTASEIDD